MTAVAEPKVMAAVITKLWTPPRACLLLTSIAGGGILVWWTLKFHQSNEQLWLVPISLLMLTTPIVIAFSSFFSSTSAAPSPELLSGDSHLDK